MAGQHGGTPVLDRIMDIVVRPRIVVLGASGGGVEALRVVLSALPIDLDAAVYVVLHTSPDSPALLASVLARATKLPVRNASDGEPIAVGSVRVAPPDFHMQLGADRVALDRGPRQNRMRPAIDALFRSAAVFHGSAVVGVILTGSLSDGSEGLAAIKRCGGYAIVQDPADATFPGMPLSAIHADAPDAVLPLREIGPRIVEALRTDRPVVPIPDALRLEAAPGLRLGARSVRINDDLGERAALTCPECGGQIWRIDGKLARYRCHIGHAYDAASFAEAKCEAAVQALWVAVRTLEERSRVLASMELVTLGAGHDLSALRFAERREELVEAARAVRHLLGEVDEQVESG
jgi:two-component system chemotaxis response regulator CheB